MRRFLITFAVLYMATACSSDSETSESADAAPEARVAQKPNPSVPASPGGNDAGPSQDDVQMTAAIAANKVPARFQGVWDYVEGNCEDESDLRMEIGDSDILFYESIGTVTDVEADGKDVVLTLSMEGEGETWEQQTRLSLAGAGAKAELQTSDGAEPKKPDEYPSKRCSA